jgi:integrase
MSKFVISQSAQIKAAPCGHGRADYGVKGEPGLQLRVTAGKPGSEPVRSWSLLYRSKVDGKQKRWTIGRYPDWSLKAAREEAQRLRLAVKQGVDPALESKEREKEKEAEKKGMTFAELGELFMTKYAKIKKKSWVEDQRILNTYLLPIFGTRPANKITKPEVRDMLDEIAARAPIQANRVQAMVRKVYNWAEKEEYVDVNPVRGLDPRSSEGGRARVMKDEELRIVWNCLASVEQEKQKEKEEKKAHKGEDQDEERETAPLSPILAEVLMLALLTGQRLNEVAGAEACELDLGNDVWTIPGKTNEGYGRTKNKLFHRVPLCPWAKELFARAFERAGGKGLLFPSPATKERLGEDAPSRAWARTSRWLELDNITAHDFRRTLSTRLGDMGEDDFTIDLVTNHVTGRSQISRKHYNHAQYDDKKRAALLKWETYLREAVNRPKPPEDETSA